jgi:RNA polymerase sigma-70 factor, ECF subfamily
MSDESRTWDRYLPYLRVVAAQAARQCQAGAIDPSSLAQESIAEAWRCRANFRGGSEETFLAWMRGILANRMKSTLRVQGRQPLRYQDIDSTIDGIGHLWSKLTDSLAVSPEEALLRSEQQVKLCRALESLAEDYRQVLLARHMEERSFREIAAEMNRTDAAVRMLWIRALQALRTAYGDSE